VIPAVPIAVQLLYGQPGLPSPVAHRLLSKPDVEATLRRAFVLLANRPLAWIPAWSIADKHQYSSVNDGKIYTQVYNTNAADWLSKPD